MKVKILFYLFFFFFIENIYSQSNFVPNASFENHLDCPTSMMQIYLAYPWFDVNSSSDYFHSCFYSPFPIPCGGASVPNNNMGYQEARTGQAYAGIGVYASGWPNGGYREYIEVKLIDTLKSNKLYCVEFWVSLSRACLNSEPDGIDGMGAYFSKDTLKYTSSDTSAVFSVVPQVYNPIGNILNDTTNWVKIFGEFTAQGGEDYMTIGNFIRDENLHIYFPPDNNGTSYYYIDDVSVMECDTTKPLPGDNIIIVFPNPVEDELTLEAKGNTLPIAFEIYNAIGQLVYKSNMIEKTVVPTANFAAGMYVIRFRNSERLEYRKVVKCN